MRRVSKIDRVSRVILLLLLHPVLLLLLLRGILHQKSSSKSSLLRRQQTSAENQIILINSFNKLSSLSMRTSRGDSDRGTNTTWHRGANTSWGNSLYCKNCRSWYRSKEVSFEGGIVRRSRIKTIGVSKLLTPYRSSIVFSRMIVILVLFSSCIPWVQALRQGSRKSSPICPTYWPKLKKKWNGASRINRTKRRLAIVV